MKKTESAQELRRKAEEKVASQPVSAGETDVNRLLHELQVHQVELEMQNEELRHANAEISEQKEHLLNIINKTPAGYFRLDLGGCFLDVNDAWLDMHGYDSADEVIGKHFRIMQVDGSSYSALAHLEELQRGVSIPHGELCSRHKDGSVGHHIFSAHPVERMGTVAGFEWFIIDITERKQAQEALKTSQERLSMALESGHMGAWELDLIHDTSWRSILHDQLFGYDSMLPEWGQDIFLSHVVSEDLDQVKDSFIQALHTGNLYFECQINRADQTLAWISAQGQVFHDETNRPVRMMGVVSDITRRKRAEIEKAKLEAQLHQSQKIESVGRLAGGVAHDYNNMLSVIIGNAELALMKAKRSAPLNDNLEHILQAANRSRDITRQLLAFARKQIINPKVSDLNVVVESMLRMLGSLLGENIDLRWQPKEGLWQVKIDPSQLDQVLANLCINARDAMTVNGKMTIKTDSVSLDEEYCKDHPDFICGNYVVLSVTDNGCGMDKETLDKVFEPFFTTKQTGEGTGLGMATVYGIVKQSGGYINVYSEPNQGTTFKIYLPRHEGEDVVSQETTVSDIQMGQGETVLLVEDEKAIVKLATAILEDLGYRVLPTNSPVEALNLLKEFQGDIHLLLTDVVMPGMNGRELAKQVQDIHPEVKTLYMSGYTANVIAHHGVLDEGINFIQKPFSRHDLSLRVREILDSNA